MKKRVAILISGGGSNMVSLVRDMDETHPATPVLVLSNNPKAGGLKKAAQLGIETAFVDHTEFNKDRRAFEAVLHSHLERANPDIICLAGFMRILSAEFIAKWQGQMLNIHPSLLPKYKGLHTHERALADGETVAGCSVHEVTADLDSGQILGQAVVKVEPDDTAQSLAARVLVQEHRLYPAVLRKFAVGDKSPVVW